MAIKLQILKHKLKLTFQALTEHYFNVISHNYYESKY